MNRLVLKSVIIKNGQTEFSNSEILQDSNLCSAVNRAIAFKGFASLAEELNEENVTVEIIIDSNYTVKKVNFKNISAELNHKLLSLIG